jgi:uncharacterized protein (TIGR03435 family)
MPDESVRLDGVPGAAPPDPSVPSAGLSIFAATEKQLGLKLRAGKAPLEVIVIEHADRPGEN